MSQDRASKFGEEALNQIEPRAVLGREGEVEAAISDDGTVKVASANGDAMKAAINWIKSIASEPQVAHGVPANESSTTHADSRDPWPCRRPATPAKLWPPA